jgi:hypothetical protein
MEKHCGMINRGKLIRPTVLWQFYNHTHLVAHQEELGEGDD